MRLFLIRHAQSANNALPEHQRVEDPPITDTGHQQAAALAEWMVSAQLTRIITSPFRRSLQTAHYVAQRLRLNPQVWVDLHEQGGCYSGYEPACYQGRPGMTHTEILAEFPQFEIEPIIDGTGWWKCQPYESEQQARQRARRLIERTLATFGKRNDRIAYVMHADFKRIVLSEIFSDADTKFHVNGNCLVLYNTSVTEIHIRNGRMHLERLNSIAHLRSSDLRTA